MENKYDYDNFDNKQVVGMLYVPDQKWENVYIIEQGFERGTIFPDLDKPWIGGYERG